MSDLMIFFYVSVPSIGVIFFIMFFCSELKVLKLMFNLSVSVNFYKLYNVYKSKLKFVISKRQQKL